MDKIVSELQEEFSKLSKSELQILGSIEQRIELKKGEYLIEQGDVASGIYMVEKGLLRQFYLKSDKDITEHFACEGGGMMCIKSLFNVEPSEYTIEALEKSTVVLVDYHKLVRLASENSQFFKVLIKLFELMLVMSQKKADSFRYESAKDRYQNFIIDYPEIANRLSINHIASYLLMSPESLSRVRSGSL